MNERILIQIVIMFLFRPPLNVGLRASRCFTRSLQSKISIPYNRAGIASINTSRFYSRDRGDLDGNGDGGGHHLVAIEKLESHRIMSIGINRPEKRNCVDFATADRLAEAFEDFEQDEKMDCAVLHGLGGSFCAGFDLEELSTADEENISNALAKLMDRGPMGPSRMEFSKPVIAAVNGWAVAGGLELALMCDIRVVEENSRLGVLCRRFGVPLIDGGTVRLPELIGLSRALDLILTGRIVEAKEAHEMGLANRLVPAGSAYGHAMNMARELARFPQECLRADRRSAYHATFASRSLEESLQFEIENGLNVISKESISGAKKFVSGLGKHGKFNVADPPEQEWQKEFKEMKSKAAEEKKMAKKDRTDDD